MIVWNKVTSYSQITAIILGVVIFAVGYNIGEQVPRPDVPNLTETLVTNEYELFKTESSHILIETSEFLTQLTFVFRAQDSKKIITTLHVSNVNIAAPTYRIEHGPTHDWLVVTRIDQSGTGYISYYDDWYMLNDSYVPTLALSYESTERIVPLGEKENTYVNTRIKELGASLKVEKTTKNCIQNEDLTDGECTESKTEELYEFLNN